MKLTEYQVDAFTDKAFGGNPAAVVVTDLPLDEALMRNLAAENNLSETAFVYPEAERWRIRWFTPTVEVELCGHATLAAAWVLAHEYNLLAPVEDKVVIVFNSHSGELRVEVSAERAMLDFPAQWLKPVALPALIAEGLGIDPKQAQCLKAQIPNGNYVVVLPNEGSVATLRPDMALLSRIHDGGIIATAEGVNVDFVSRFFAPYYGIPEDPVTGSAHCSLVPYWAQVFSLKELTAKQLSARGGDLLCRLDDERVLMWGQAVTVKQSQWRLSEPS